MDSYPYQRNQMQFPSYYYYPNIEANPPQMKMEPPKSPFPYEQPWTYAGNYGHPMHFCCGHNNFPGCFSYRPPYHHHAPVPSPMYYSASGSGYSAYGEPFFVPYGQQPHYSMELPRYEFDKNIPRDYHCCGCPNHRCHQNGAKGAVRIEEEEPDLGKKVKDDHDALAPVQMRNYPYPIVWIPPEYTSNKEAKSDDHIADDRKPWSPRNFRADAEEPRESWNGWIPIDLNRMPSTVHEGDVRRRSQNLQGESNNMKESEEYGRTNHNSRIGEKRPEYQFPIIWMPYYNKQEEENGRENSHDNFKTPKCIEEVPHSLKTVPVNSKSDEGVTNGIRSNQVESKKVPNEKIIPVKEVEFHQGKSDSEETGRKRERTIPVFHKIEENVTKKDSHTDREKLSTSPQKNGKLPPVCLRVDPLPRKKNGNGNSRSPSPPASKERSKALSGGDSNEQNEPNIGQKVKPKETTIAVSETKTKDKAPSDSLNDKAYPGLSLQNVPFITEKVEPKERTIQVNENETDENMEAKGSILVGEKEESMAEKGAKHIAEEGGNLSEEDAAVLIQAAYRGYQVRRWEPLKKLKQIDEVSKELTNVRDRVEALENSSDLQNDEKQRIAIGETIMRLLLKLDTIQGLHSSFREIRKSLARELTSFQERLDSIMVKKPQLTIQEFSDTKSVEETSMNTQNEECIQEQQEEKDAVPREDSVEGINHETAEKCEDLSQLLVDSVDDCNSASDVSESEKMVVESEAKLEKENISNEVDNFDYMDSNALRELPVGVIDEDVADHSSKKDEQDDSAMRELDSASNGEDSDANPMKELPVGVIDEDIASSEFGKYDGSKMSIEEPQREDVESLVELPVGVLDDDTVKPEFENHIDETETSKEDEAGKCNVDEISSFAMDETAKKETQLQQQFVEEKEEAQSSGESDGWVKVEFNKLEENKGDVVSQDIEIEYEEEAKNEANDEESMAVNEVRNFQPELVELVKGIEERVEKVSKEEPPQVKDQDILAEQENSYNNEETETMNKKKTEMAVASHVSEVIDDVSENDKGLNADKKLLEENEKLREMMKKLLEAGDEQMNVITDLTGRVKDLEKRLARSKRVKTKRFKPATSKTRSNSISSLHERAISVA